MEKEYQYQVLISDQNRIDFAHLSGDFNPLHVDSEYASSTEYGKCILHGAFSSGLFSRLAGMYIPGEKCVLTDMKIKFLSPTITPCELIVTGKTSRVDQFGGEVKVSIIDKMSGNLLTNGSYSYILHSSIKKNDNSINNKNYKKDSIFLVTGASGGLGSNVLSILGNKARGLSLSNGEKFILLNSYSDLAPLEKYSNIKGIIHCAGPSPDNIELTSTYDLETSINNNISKPLKDIVSLSKFLIEKGVENAPLIIIGSSAASLGRHNWKSPMYSLSKSLIPNLTKILALELARHNKRVIGLTYELLDGGMNNNLSKISNQINADRMLTGELTSMGEAAKQVKWIIDNSSSLISGSLIDCTGGAIP